MEVVTVEELELQLSKLVDPIERRRMRGKIRRLRRRQGLGGTVSLARVRITRSKNPYEAETWQESVKRLREQATELGVAEDVSPRIADARETWHTFPRTNHFQVCVESYIASRETPPRGFCILYIADAKTLDYRDAILALGPI
jgi:hypothetical protein